MAAKADANSAVRGAGAAAGAPSAGGAVCGGAGDSLLPAVASSNADAYVTSDLRHHPATEFRADHDIALLDISHWAGEWLWLDRAAALLHEQVSAAGGYIEVQVSRHNTDPWTFSVPGDFS